MRVDCNLEERENCVAGAMLYYIIRFMADHVISAVD